MRDLSNENKKRRSMAEVIRADAAGEFSDDARSGSDNIDNSEEKESIR